MNPKALVKQHTHNTHYSTSWRHEQAEHKRLHSLSEGFQERKCGKTPQKAAPNMHVQVLIGQRVVAKPKPLHVIFLIKKANALSNEAIF